ncbi:MAG: hypothetical protein LBU34_18085 [Planctomycetaceae bacterium]|nr:hypothetical protein [Planctomycetaceae bacterium]
METAVETAIDVMICGNNPAKLLFIGISCVAPPPFSILTKSKSSLGKLPTFSFFQNLLLKTWD